MAMSGGIDSSVAAMLLLEQGYELVGITFRTYDTIRESCLAKEKGCCSMESMMEAKHLAAQLGFEHHILDFRTTFQEQVISNFVTEYLHGRTPNPCVLCNSHIKWGELQKAALEYGCDFIATGHYARIVQQNDCYYLAYAVDTKKDQTYFLWMLTQENLRHTLFPLGTLTKPMVREIALQHGFEQLSHKRESQEICFVADNDYRTFLQPYAALQPAAFQKGAFLNASGQKVGEHMGFAQYTIGQRKGLGIALGYPAYVTHIDPQHNTVTLGEHDDLYATSLIAHQARLHNPESLQASPQVTARIRYRSQPVQARIELLAGNTAFALHFDTPVWGVTPGQSVVLYQNGLLVGGGIID